MWLNESKTNALPVLGPSWYHYLFLKRATANSTIGGSLAFILLSAVMETSVLTTRHGRRTQLSSLKQREGRED
jgi:hypothetical protein